MKTYKMTIAGCERELTLCRINSNLKIAAFIMFGDTEITVKSAEELLKKIPEFDVILTAEAKGIPLAYELSRQSGKPYVVARKSVKLYMSEPVSINVKSISTDKDQTLYIDSARAEVLKGKRVLVADDVISTGESIHALHELCSQIGAEVVCNACVLAEGDAADREDIVYLEKLPLFFE
ncbi:MAG: adenine phosphoribosyltransferase [Ruminococcus sp.]|nr:adenine phosphoribosyltransferase [Ruminococcus sp.]